MKIRNHTKRTWYFMPCDSSKLHNGKIYKFKYKSDLMKLLNNNFVDALNGTVSLGIESFNISYTLRQWFVWYNDSAKYTHELKIDLRQLYFRGNKYISKKHKINKSDKKYFAFSDKIISLMSNIEDENYKISQKDAKRLVDLFYKRGFKDFIPNEEDLTYINGHISDGIQFSYWSDRCDTLRMKTIIEYFKRQNLI